MSVRVMSLVFDKYPNGGAEMLTMLALADWCDDAGGNLFPSISAVAKKTRVTRSQAQRNVHRLIDLGYVRVTGNANGGNPKATRQYKIDLERLTGSTNATGSVHATGRVVAQEGPHGCGETGSTDAAQSISEPSMTRQSHVGSIAADRSVLANVGKGLPPCPHQEILALYAEELPMLPQPRIWEGARQKNLAARWRWFVADRKAKDKPHSRQDALGFFRDLFAYIAKSDLLMGRKSGWSCDLGWIVKAENFAKIIQGNYENKNQ